MFETPDFIAEIEAGAPPEGAALLLARCLSRLLDQQADQHQSLEIRARARAAAENVIGLLERVLDPGRRIEVATGGHIESGHWVPIACSAASPNSSRRTRSPQLGS